MAILQVPITKAAGFIEVDYDNDIPQALLAEIVIQGLKVVLNRGASKITKELYNDPDELKAAAMAKAQEQYEMLKEGKTKRMGTKSTQPKGMGVVMTEARRIARNLVKDEIKRQGGKISHYEAAEITKAANALIKNDPSILETAKVNLEERAKVPVKIDVATIAVSDKKIKAAEATKAKKKETLSAKQAGKVQPRAKPGKATSQPQARA